MEVLQPKKQSYGIRPVVAVGVAAFILTCTVIACGKALKTYSLRDSLDPALPVLDLNVVYYSTAGQPLMPSSESAKNDASGKGEARACPIVFGGDLKQQMPPVPEFSWGEPTPVPCPLKATWNVYRHPVAVSLHVKKGADLLEWYETNESFAKLRSAGLWKGFVEGASRFVSVRGEELGMNTLPLDDWRGEFVKPLIKDALQADAVIHYDVAHGAGGVVLDFDRQRATLMGRAIPVLVRALASAAYSRGAAHEAIIQLRLQGRRIYLTQINNRVLFGSSLEGLLNVADQLSTLSQVAPAIGTSGTVQAVIRAEAFFDKVLPALIGKDAWPLSIALNLSGQSYSISDVFIPEGSYSRILASAPMQGVVAAVPRDVTAALVLSAKLPLTSPVKEWSFDKAAQGDGVSSGVSFVWDIRGEAGESHYGVAVAAPTTALGKTPGASSNANESALTPADFLNSAMVSSTCAGGAVWIGASSDQLLSRMQDACNKNSLSLLDLKEINAADLLMKQVSFVVNASIAVRELYRLGGGATYSTAEDAKEMVLAQKKLLAEVDGATKELPVIGLSGGSDTASGGVHLKGFFASLGGA